MFSLPRALQQPVLFNLIEETTPHASRLGVNFNTSWQTSRFAALPLPLLRLEEAT